MMGWNINDHPPLADLALCARRELSPLRQWQVNLHLRHCQNCQDEVQRFRITVLETQRMSESATEALLEAALDWSRLQREMVGNIHVGIAAAECVGRVRTPVARSWRVAAVVTVLVLVFVFGWFYNIPREDTERIAGAFRAAFKGTQAMKGTLLQTTTRGVSIRSQGGSLTILRPDSSQAAEPFYGDGSVGLRYIDGETGQVTITNVYGQ
jgi:hypothetical protein